MASRCVRAGCSLAAALLLFTATNFAQQTSTEPGYVEINWMKVKQDKLSEFGQTVARITDANRRGKGDHWVAFANVYGRDNQVWMISGRPSLNDIEPASQQFMGSLKEFLGYSPDRFAAEISRVVESSGSELWVRRPDLSWNIKDTGDWEARVAKARYMVCVTVHVKPGHMAEASKQIQMVKDAVVAHGDGAAVASVTQVMMGGDPSTFYIRMPLDSMMALAQMPSPRSMLGEEAYRQYSEMAAQNYASLDYSMQRMVPEWSNPPASFIEANPKMWKAKPMAVKPKPAAADKPPAGGGH